MRPQDEVRKKKILIKRKLLSDAYKFIEKRNYELLHRYGKELPKENIRQIKIACLREDQQWFPGSYKRVWGRKLGRYYKHSANKSERKMWKMYAREFLNDPEQETRLRDKRYSYRISNLSCKGW